MSAEAIPFEILVMIFRKLKGTDAAACRAVCRRWRDVVDSFTDDVWQHFCARDFSHPWKHYCARDISNPKRAKDVSNLSYRDLYKSLTLWSKVEEAEEKCPAQPVDNVTSFKVLNNNTVVVSICDFITGFLCTGLINNVIEYYDVRTMTLISHKTYQFSIRRYDENDKLIVLMDADYRIHVIIKSNDKEFVVGNSDESDYYNCKLMETEVYFKNARDMLCVARLKVVDSEETVETEELTHFAENVVAFARSGDDGVNILTEQCKIHCYRNKKVEYGSFLYSWMPNIIYELSYYGFHWSDMDIYRWLSSNFLEEDLKITKLKSAAIHVHNHVALLGTCRRTVHVYKRPYKKNRELKLYSSRPDRIIDLTKHPEIGTLSGNIQQLGVVETLHGHRLLVLCSRKLFCVDLSHKQLNETTTRKEKENKKKATTTRKEELNKKKAAKTRTKEESMKKATTTRTKEESMKKATTTRKEEENKKNAQAGPLKRVYMTRSMAKCLRNNKKLRLL